MVAENDEEENNSLFSTRNFQQSNGGTTGLMETKVAIEDFKTTPSKPLFSKHQCLKENETPLLHVWFYANFVINKKGLH